MNAKEALDLLEGIINNLLEIEDCTCTDDYELKEASYEIAKAISLLEKAKVRIGYFREEEMEKEEEENDQAEREETRAYYRSIAGSQGFPPKS